ncbi:MAG: protein kinase [Pseudomonadota bacterium]
MQLEGYTDLTRINRGGMAAIYRGRQTSLDRTVAIKYLSAEYLWDDQAKALFEQESRVIAQLNHPNIIHVIDRGFSSKGRPYFVMEFVEGEDLESRMQRRKISAVDKVEMMIQVCKGLAFAHKNGIVHRDIKPANLLVDQEGHVRILDFGIAWLSAQGKPASDTILGTPDYMSPEQLNRPDAVGPLSDVFALGAVMYHLFTGATQTSRYPDWETALGKLPPTLADVVGECLAVEPGDRPASIDAVQIRLLRFLNGAHIGATQKREARSDIGSVSGKFRLLDITARNRFGALYLFEDKKRQRLWAIKKRNKSLAGFASAKSLKSIEHPNIVPIQGVSRGNGTFIVVMPHFAGGNLRDRLSRPCSALQFVEFALPVCSALACAHQHQLVHGNLHPENILFDESGHVSIGDFGFDRRLSNPQARDYQIDNNSSASVAGDIYAAGAIFHHCLTAKPVFRLNGRLRMPATFLELDDELAELICTMLEPAQQHELGGFAGIESRLRDIGERLEKEDDANSGQTNAKRSLATIVGLSIAAVFVGGYGLLSTGAVDPDRLVQLIGAWFGRSEAN